MSDSKENIDVSAGRWRIESHSDDDAEHRRFRLTCNDPWFLVHVDQVAVSRERETTVLIKNGEDFGAFYHENIPEEILTELHRLPWEKFGNFGEGRFDFEEK